MSENQTRAGARRAVRSMLATDYACAEEDFLSERVVIVEARAMPGRPAFPIPARPFLMATTGAGVVISCHRERMDWARETFGEPRRDRVFSSASISLLERYVRRDRQLLVGPNLGYATSRETFRPAAPPEGINVRLVERDAIAQFYDHRRFEHALAYETKPPWRDMLAAVATRGGEVIGIAGASAPSDAFWGIGVDVRDTDRGAGIGKAVVSCLAGAILDMGQVPYYATAVSNIRSATVAYSLGFWPAWTDIYVREG